MSRYEARLVYGRASYGVWDCERGCWVTAQNMWDTMAEHAAERLNAGWDVPVCPPRSILVWIHGGWWPSHLCRWQRRPDHRGEYVWWGQVAVDADGRIGWWQAHSIRLALDDRGSAPLAPLPKGAPRLP